MAEPFLYAVSHVEAVIAIVVQLTGMFLILSSTAMFVKQETLHRLEHILQMNVLFCSTAFLLIDWILVLPGTWPCEVFSLGHITFGSAVTFSTVGIAFGRYKKMLGISNPISKKSWNIVELVMTWLASLLVIVYPLIEKIRPVSKPQYSSQFTVIPAVQNDTLHREKWICVFKNTLLYKNVASSGIFLLVAVILPISLMLYFYIKIFQKLRKARINAWLNNIALQRSRQTQVIKCGGRKANVFQMKSAPSGDQNAHRFNELAFSREKSVLLKGVFSAGVVLVCWLPYTGVWLYLSMNGFQSDYLPFTRYLMITSKVSVILNVLHYICLNVKYRNLYIQTMFGQLTSFIHSLYNDNEEQTSQIISQVAARKSSSGFEKPIFTTRCSRRLLEPIEENQPRDNIEQKQENHAEDTLRNTLKSPAVHISKGIQIDDSKDINQQESLRIDEKTETILALPRVHRVKSNSIHPLNMN